VLSSVCLATAMRISAMKRKMKVKTLKRRRAVLETVELDGEESAISHSFFFFLVYPKKLPAN